MNDIELLKANLNAEKVFYNLRWHELIPEGSSDNSNTEINSTEINSNDSICSISITDLNKKNSVNNLNKTQSSRSSKTSRDISSPKKAIIRESRNDKKNSPNEILNKNNDNDNNNNNNNKRFPKRFSLASVILDMLNTCFNINKCCCKERNGFKCIEEIEDENTNLLTDFKPPVDIFYNEEKVLLFCLVSGKIKNLQVAFDKNNDILTISGTKLLYDHFTDENFVSHEIKSGYFKRMFLFKKTVFEEEVTYHYENGVIKIVVPFRKEE